jgi:hypothetical protein
MFQSNCKSARHLNGTPLLFELDVMSCQYLSFADILVCQFLSQQTFTPLIGMVQIFGTMLTLKVHCLHLTLLFTVSIEVAFSDKLQWG